MPIIDDFMRHCDGYIFSSPVDPVSLNIPDYFEIVKQPMDLSTVKKRLETGAYRDPAYFKRDTQLVFDNAIISIYQSSIIKTIVYIINKNRIAIAKHMIG